MANFLFGVAGLLLCLLPLCGLVFMAFAFRLRGEGWRSAIIASAVCSALYIVITTEVLSVFRLITRPGLVAAWIIFDAASLLYIRSLSRKKIEDGSVKSANGATPYTLTRSDAVLLTGTAFVVGLIGLTAALAPPNTLDVLAYHLPRVAIWAINKNVWNYPTYESQQLFLSPWAEYAILHLYVLSGADYLSNFVEWFSLIGMILSVSLVAERLGASIRGQIFAAVACATMPGLVLEASGSMNTCVGAFWIVVCVYYFLRGNEDRNWVSSAGAASAAGLAIFTKGTAYIFLPFLLLACWLSGDAGARKFWVRQMPLFVLMLLLLHGPLYVRNYQLSGSPLGLANASGADEQRQYANTRHSVGVTYANIVRNAALHLGTPVHAVNSRIESVTRRALVVFGVDPDDPGSTARGGFSLPALTRHEASVGSFLQCFLIVAAFFLLFSKRYGDRKLRLMAFGTVLSYVLFCTLLRWTQWNARYALPVICVGLPIAAVVVERSLSKVVTVALAIILLIIAMPFALQNSIRPLAPWKLTSLLRRPRLNFYFEEWQQSLEPAYKFAVAQVKQSSCRDVGIDSSMDDVEYPLMAMFRLASHDIRFRFYRVRNVTAKYERRNDSLPCTVICLRCAQLSAKWAEYRDIGGRTSTFDELAVFSSNGSIDNNQTLTLPQPFDPWNMSKQLDVARDAVASTIFMPEGHSGLSATISRVDQAGERWPGKALDLQARLHGVETLSLKAWRARDSIDPMLRRGERLNYSDADPVQFMAASELLDNWKNEAPGRIHAVNDLIEQLYTSSELHLEEVPRIAREGSGACRVRVEKLVTAPNRPSPLSSQKVVELEDCRCLRGNLSIGEVIARKPPGAYDSEETVIEGCKIVSVQ